MANVLIIDDDRAICDMLTGMIRDMGHHAEYVCSRIEGRELATPEVYPLPENGERGQRRTARIRSSRALRTGYNTGKPA